MLHNYIIFIILIAPLFSYWTKLLSKIAETNSDYSRTFSLFTWSKQKWLFWRAGFYPANHRNL